MKAYLRERLERSPYYQCVLKWQENGKPKRKEVSTGIPIKGNNKRKAEKKCEEIRQEYEAKYEHCSLSSMADILFSEYMTQWLDTEKRFLKPSTSYGYSHIIDKHINPYFKNLGIRLIDLKPQHIQKYYNDKLDSGLNPNTVRRHHANIRKALQAAVEQDIIPYNIADRTKLAKIKKYDAHIYNEKQLLELIKVVKGTPIESVLVLCIAYGLRRSEVCGLRWSDVDLGNRILHITNTRVMTDKEIFQDTTKNLSSKRDLPINDELYSYLIYLQKKQQQDKLFMGEAYGDTEFICRWDDGTPLKVSYVSHAFSKLLEDNGLPHIRLHDIRHSVATNLLQNGIDLKIIQEYLGHSNIATTATFYLHPDFEQKKNATNIMTSLLEISK